MYMCACMCACMWLWFVHASVFVGMGMLSKGVCLCVSGEYVRLNVSV